MKRSFALTIATFILGSCSANFQDFNPEPCSSSDVTINANYSKGPELHQLLIDLTKTGVPGVSIAIYSGEGWWTASAGYARIENQTLMESCHLQYLQSISKTYMATTILKLYEAGKIDLDQKITEYLPEEISDQVSDADKITVRMLLNHTSGVPEYNFDTDYVTTLLQHPDHVFAPADYIDYIDGKNLTFEPGSKFAYRNTNYVLLALIADYVTGDHAQYMEQSVFEPLGLSNTFYRNDPGYLEYPNLANSYWDRYGNSILENGTYLQRQNVSMLVGDDGIVATPVDAIKFLRALMEGQVLSASTLEEMKAWVKDSEGKERYGLGLDYQMKETSVGFGHGGAGIGAGAELLYFPEKNIYVFIAINLGVVTDSPIHRDAEKILDKIYSSILN